MVQIPHAEEGKICPLHKQDMSEVCHKCPWWTKLQGAHPSTGERIDEWGCAVTWLPILLIEGAKETKTVGAEIARHNNELMALAGFPNGHPEAKAIDTQRRN